MKFGSMIWYGRRPLRSALETTHRLGFDYVEFSLDYPWPEGLSEEERNLLESLGDEYGLELAFHAPWAGQHISHPRDEISAACLKVFERCLDFAGGFNPLYFNFHQSMEASTFYFEEVRVKIFEKALASTTLIVDMGRRHGFPVTIENNPTPFFGSPDQLEFALQVEGLKMCLDVGHVFLSRRSIKRLRAAKLFDQRLGLEDWFNQFKDRILTVHLHDCRVGGVSGPRDHLAFGRGNLDFERIAEMIGETSCGHVLIETYYADGKGFPITERELERSLRTCRSLMETL
ncbi:MAG: sugar phosphate isomerase/epimerase family protein [Candidatus Geothermarchaeales archaeon]